MEPIKWREMDYHIYFAILVEKHEIVMGYYKD
jgi:hypothetical protein